MLYLRVGQWSPYLLANAPSEQGDTSWHLDNSLSHRVRIREASLQQHSLVDSGVSHEQFEKLRDILHTHRTLSLRRSFDIDSLVISFQRLVLRIVVLL